MLTLGVGELTCILPGGYLDAAGARHQDMVISLLSGYEEEFLALNHHILPARLLTALLARCVRRIGDIAPVTERIARDLLVADRLYALLMLRVATFGSRFRAVITCPQENCHTKMNVDFDAEDIPVKPLRNAAPTYTVMLPEVDIECVLRLPNGSDQEILESQLYAGNDEGAMQQLLARCVVRPGQIEQSGMEYIAQLDTRAQQALGTQIAELAPSVDLTMEGVCAVCGHAFTMPFDLLGFILQELSMGTGVLYREVHYLAYHYHWSEAEIMRMARPRRRTYIDLLSEHIETTYGV